MTIQRRFRHTHRGIRIKYWDMFKQFQASIERETRRKLKCIQTYGKEYLGPFDEYCKQ